MQVAISMDAALCLVYTHDSSVHVLLFAVVSDTFIFTVVVAVTALVTMSSLASLLIVGSPHVGSERKMQTHTQHVSWVLSAPINCLHLWQEAAVSCAGVSCNHEPKVGQRKIILL